MAGKIGRDGFMDRLRAEFPDIFLKADKHWDGLLHLEMAEVRRHTNAAIESGDFLKAERLFVFVDSLIDDADDALENAIFVSFCDHFYFNWDEDYRHAESLVPERLLGWMRRYADDCERAADDWARRERADE